MTDNNPDRPIPETRPVARHQAEPPAQVEGRLFTLGERAADNLIRMTTTAGATITDLDADPTLRATALTLGREYVAVDLNVVDAQLDRLAALVALRWPRPGDHSWLTTAGEVFAGVNGLLAPMGRVAVLLDPTPALAFGITWTGTLLAAATAAGLPALQDVVCLHDLEADATGRSEAPAFVTLQHRVILLLGTGKARHVAH